MAQVWEMPTDLGDALDDPSLSETLLFDPIFYKDSYASIQHQEYTGQLVDAIRSVVFIWDRMNLPQSLTDSAARLPNHLIFGRRSDIPPDISFQRWLDSLSTIGISSSNAITALSRFLSRQPLHSELHHLLVSLGSRDGADERCSLLASLVQALNSPHCKIDGFMLDQAASDDCLLVAETLLQPLTPDSNGSCRGCDFQCLGFNHCLLHWKFFEILAKMLQSQVSKLSELSLCGSCDFVRYFESLRHLTTALQRGHCKLTRLDIRGCTINEKGLNLLLESLQDNQQSLRDLGLTIFNEKTMSILCGALAKPCFHFQILRLGSIFQEEIAASLAEALGGQHCKVRVLDLASFSYNYMNGLPRFCQTLQKQPHKVQCLRFDFSDIPLSSEIIRVLADFLSSNGCPLLWLECRCHSYGPEDATESILAEALENNYRICTLSFPWRNRAAEARASSFLARNCLYRSGGLLEQEFVKPHTAKLFICGHAEVGKTTLCNCLLKASAPFSSCNRYLGCGPLVHLCGAKKAGHTRGMELHTLSFSPCGGGPKHLVICDLAGQQEYHAFHHYFISGSNKDLFLVVCKYHSSLLQEELESQLEYWFRFIVCHRSSGNTATKPKVIVLLNFFYDANSMNEISRSKCNQLLHKYSDELDFGFPGEENVFGIMATKTSQVIPLVGILENLTGQLLQNRATIPMICDEISFHILRKLLTNGMQYSRKKLFVHYSHLFNLYYQHFQTQPKAMPSRETFQAALSELHNAGQIVFFRPIQEAGLQTDPLVITDCAWFCHDLIGSLLAPMEFRKHFNKRRTESWVWDEEDVKQMLRNQKCEEKYLDEILRYLQSLELCYPVTLPESPHKHYLLFPALLRNDVRCLEVANQADMSFLGRRLKCQDTAKQLLPSGVFARLQVKLHDFCGNNSYKVGYGFIGFSKDFIHVMVRFGGDTGRWEDRQWIDILISYPNNRHSWIADGIMEKVKTLIYEICQAAEKGCPTMFLQESILRDNTPGSEALPLVLIQDKVLQKGIRSSVEWEDGECVETIQVLLPSELKQHATSQLHAVTDVQMEFSASDERSRGSLSHSWEVEDVSGLDESSQKLWQLIKHRFDNLEASILGSLQDIKNEIGMLAGSLQQVERHIISNCSTHLLTQLLETTLPLYPYLTTPDGKWQNLMSLVAGERMQLHFLCEEGPHEIEKQEGLTIIVKPAEWLVKIAPVLVPALRVFCCAARLAATVYLPGSSHVFVPSPDFLQSLGLSDDALQRQILPEALKALAGGISNVDKLSCQLLQEGEVRECLAGLLRGQDVNMRNNFLLRRVLIDGKGKRHIFWVCPEHALGQKVLKEENPFG